MATLNYIHLIGILLVSKFSDCTGEDLRGAILKIMQNVMVSSVREAAKKYFFDTPSFTLPPALFVAGPLKKLHFFWLPLPLRAFVLNLLEVGGLHASVGGPNLLSDKPVHTLQT